MTKKIKIIILSLSFLWVGLFISSSAVALAAPLGNGCNGQTQSQCLKNNPIVMDIQKVVNFLSAGVAIVIAGSIIVAGIQYTMGGNQPQVLKAAQNRIINSIIALFVFLLLFAFVQWIIPGGIFQ